MGGEVWVSFRDIDKIACRGGGGEEAFTTRKQTFVEGGGVVEHLTDI